MGFSPAPELTSQNYKVDISGSQFVIPLGAASAHFFKLVSATIFAEVKTVDQRFPSLQLLNQPATVLELKIEDSKIDARSFVGAGGRNLCWAELIYRFTVFSSIGDELATWRVRGIGERVNAVLDGSIFSDAVELAMRDAAEKFQTSFFNVPEARRWVHKLPAANVDAPAEKQTSAQTQTLSTASYPGVTTVNVEYSRDKDVPQVLSAQVTVSNDGSGKLFVRPLDVTFERPGGVIVRTTPTSALAAAVSPQLARVNPGLAYGPGLALGGPPGFAAVSLVTMLINVALIEAENRSIEDALSKYKAETLKDITLWPGDSVEFAVHFVGVPDQGTGHRLTVPVIELDSATRYNARLPVR